VRHARYRRGPSLTGDLGRPSSEPILETLDSFFLCTVITAEKLAISFQPMTDDAASAGAAYRCHRVNCALEAIERHGPIAHRHLKRFIVVVAASVAALFRG
jgi:hypothetical protein